ncbi:MAG: PadR family transcriptional regulator [Ignisphaera sp.]
MRPMDRGIAKAFVLKLLVERPLHGYEIMKRINEITGFVPSPGHIYMLLKKLEKEDLVDVTVTYFGGRRIRLYKLSEKGRKFLEDNKDLVNRVDTYVERFRRAKEIELHKLLKVAYNIFESLDRMSNEKIEYLRNVIENFVKDINKVIGW